MKKYTQISLLLCFLIALGAVASAHAQTPTTIQVPSGGGIHFVISPDGTTAATYEELIAYTDYRIPKEYLPIRLFDLSTGQERLALMGQTDGVNGLLFTSDGSKVVSSHSNGMIYVWDTTSGDMLQELRGVMGNRLIGLLADNHTAIILSNTTFMFWDIETGYITQLLARHFDTWGDFIDLGSTKSVALTSWAASAISADGAWLAAADPYGEVRLWKVATAEEYVLAEGAEQPRLPIRKMQFLPDGKTLAYYQEEEALFYLWDVTHESIAATPVKDGKTWATDGDRIVFIIDGNTLSLIKLAQPTVIQPLSITLPDGRYNIPASLGFVPNTNQLAVTPILVPAIYLIDLP